jgi:hypothetical protein
MEASTLLAACSTAVAGSALVEVMMAKTELSAKATSVKVRLERIVSPATSPTKTLFFWALSQLVRKFIGLPSLYKLRKHL